MRRSADGRGPSLAASSLMTAATFARASLARFRSSTRAWYCRRSNDTRRFWTDWRPYPRSPAASSLICCSICCRASTSVSICPFRSSQNVSDGTTASRRSSWSSFLRAAEKGNVNRAPGSLTRACSPACCSTHALATSRATFSVAGRFAPNCDSAPSSSRSNSPYR